MSTQIKRLVVLESPFRGKTEAETKRNIRYARACMRDCLFKGDAPFASHILYALGNVLNDANPGERRLGMHAGFAWSMGAEATVVYTDLGISEGMMEGIRQAEKAKRKIEKRNLPNWESLI